MLLFFYFRYQYNVDKDITQLKFVSSLDKKLRGVINWFPVHPTSMNNTNTLISSDNVGYASILLEQYMNKNEILGKVSSLYLYSIRLRF